MIRHWLAQSSVWRDVSVLRGKLIWTESVSILPCALVSNLLCIHVYMTTVADVNTHRFLTATWVIVQCSLIFPHCSTVLLFQTAVCAGMERCALSRLMVTSSIILSFARAPPQVCVYSIKLSATIFSLSAVPCYYGNASTCAPNHRCLTQNTTGSIFCLESCYIQNGGCSDDQVCYYERIDEECNPLLESCFETTCTDSMCEVVSRCQLLQCHVYQLIVCSMYSS